MRKLFLSIQVWILAGTLCYGDTSIVLDGNNIKGTNVNGLTFKGFGVVSANGTSALLMDYKSEHPEEYAEMLNILFGGTRPIMTQVKIEMGNDRNNSTGPDPATMRLESEAANVQRAPGFQLAADAKKINPNLKVSILRWNAPGWVTGNDKVYTWYKNTILAAYRSYGYMVDYVNPGVNESSPDLAWTKQYAEQVKADTNGFNNATEQALYNSIKVVISDEVGIGSFGSNMVSDATLRNDVSIAGYHYNTDDDSAGDFTRLAEQFDKEVWNSEAQATFGNTAFRPNNNLRDPTVAGTGIGGINGPLEMGNTIIKGFVNSRRTHFIYQPAIGSFYEGGQYSFKELISARDPWSGWIHYDVGLDILRHFSWFAKTGWENADNTAGIWRVVPQTSFTGATGVNPVNGRNGTPSYLTLAAPDAHNFSTVFMNDSENTQIYKLQTVNMGYPGNPALEQWETRAADAGTAFNSNYLKYLGNISADAGGVYSITVKPYSVVTVTTLTNSGSAEFATPLPVESARNVLDTDATGSVQNTTDKFLYADSFDYSAKTVPVIGPGGQITGTDSYIASRGGSKSVIPRFTSDRNGAFEAYLPDGSTNYVLRQQLDQSVMGLGGTWNNGNPITGIGDNRWLNYKASVDVSFENNSTQGGNNYAAIGARQQGGSNSHYMNGTPYFLKFWFDGGWMLKVDGTTVAGGNVVSGSGGVTIAGFNAAYNAWHNIALQVVENRVTAYLDGVALATYTDSNPRLSGRVDLASGYYFTRFDNLKVETTAGYPPYYSEMLDDLEMNDLASPPAAKLIYGGAWAHANGKSMYNYERTLSTSQGTGSTLQYTFTGTGLDILGPNDGSAQLAVTVDGQVVNSAASTMASKEFYQTFTLRGLAFGTHTVQVQVLSGTLVVDSVAAVAAPIADVPAGLAATAISSSQIALIWNALTNASGYNLKRSLTNGGPYTTVASGVTVTNYSDTGLAGGTIYYYVVSAIVSGNETSDSAQATAMTISPTWGSLIHRYSFAETGGANVADSVGGPIWTGTLPNGGVIGGQLTLASASQQYASLPAGIVGSISNFTIMAWVNLSTSSNWSRIFDFGNGTATNMFLTPRNGVNNLLRFGITTNGAGSEQQINCSSTLSTGVWHQAAVTMSGSTGILYLDGVAVGTNNGITINPSSLGITVNNYIGKSQYPDPYLNGTLDEFRIYNSALSSAEIAATAALAPSQLLGTNSPLVSLQLTATNLAFAWPLTNAGFTLQMRTNLVSGNWVNVTSPAPQIIGNTWQVSLPVSASTFPAFFRLIK